MLETDREYPNQMLHDVESDLGLRAVCICQKIRCDAFKG